MEYSKKTKTNKLKCFRYTASGVAALGKEQNEKSTVTTEESYSGSPTAWKDPIADKLIPTVENI